LQEFTVIDCYRLLEAAQSAALDPLLRALAANPHFQKIVIITKCASAEAVKYLRQLQAVIDLRLALKADQWLAVADEI
jgi:hypothetical protein